MTRLFLENQLQVVAFLFFVSDDFVLYKWQAYYLSVPFPVEKVPTQRIRMGKDIPDNGVVVSQLLNYPMRGFVFEGGLKLRNLSNAVASSCIRLQNKNIPFNVLIADCGRRIFLFPQVNVALSKILALLYV